MHEKRFKIDFFANFRKLQKKLPICKKKYAEILNVDRAVVTSREKKVKSNIRIFFGSAKVHPDCKHFFRAVGLSCRLFALTQNFQKEFSHWNPDKPILESFARNEENVTFLGDSQLRVSQAAFHSFVLFAEASFPVEFEDSFLKETTRVLLFIIKCASNIFLLPFNFS